MQKPTETAVLRVTMPHTTELWHWLFCAGKSVANRRQQFRVTLENVWPRRARYFVRLWSVLGLILSKSQSEREKHRAHHWLSTKHEDRPKVGFICRRSRRLHTLRWHREGERLGEGEVCAGAHLQVITGLAEVEELWGGVVQGKEHDGETKEWTEGSSASTWSWTCRIMNKGF